MDDELLKTVQEIQSSSRLNDLFHTSEGQCSCFRKQERYQQDIQELQAKISEIESVVKEKDKVQKELNAHLKERIDSLEISLMAVQTDDSKLHSASLRKTQAALKQGHSVTELVKQISASSFEEKPESRENTNQVYHTKNIEYSVPVTQVRDSSEACGSQGLVPDSKAPSKDKSKQDTDSIQKDTVGKLTEKDKSNTTVTDNENRASLKERYAVRQNNEKADIDKVAPSSQKSARLDPSPTKKPVIKQSIRKTHGNEQFWRYLAKQEMEEGKRSLKDLEGVHTVLCLDISASMADENAWTEAKTFVLDYLNGLEDISSRHGLTNEHVALVTFGHETKVQKRLTNKYSEIRQLVEMQQLGGPSPLYGGLVFGLAAAGASNHTFEVVNHIQVFTKVIIVTDGRLTEVGQYEGPDTPVENLDETKAKIIQGTEEYKSWHIDTYFVPVGRKHKETNEFLDLMLAVTDGKKLDFKSGRQLSRRHFLTTKIANPLGLFGDTSLPFITTNQPDFSAEDKRMIDEIKADARKHIIAHMNRVNGNTYREIEGSNLPPIGSRVRRGPDWRWNMQDSNGPGTVIGHARDQIHVEWDTDGHQNVYQYGRRGYDVLIVEEPRQLKPGQKIAVGCVVKPGKDWAQSSAKGQYMQKGVVIKLDQPKATVRWENGEKGDYSYGVAGKYEIEVCAGLVASGSEGHALGSGVTTTPPKKKTKNKNKNVH
ncbi:uncharacterized protein LOC123534444 isoform X2 [Mercenaria mercenaria]|uniref:uncharacterized protein LOC123534444 isoform X1 n=1 Tax=Mercenaria mercenaria TaxID=6596 RepID=UPI00234EE719|nr:uncharacterized protein LOC123534444 isoform X1 [Mercenaria mercenaria]XP_053375558.1 uncharacterized protein LOC123534444 isoform X2 [Mercenaria mercenaria]